MRYLIILLSLILSFSVVAAEYAPEQMVAAKNMTVKKSKNEKNKKQKTKEENVKYTKLYMFGVSTSFTDSVVYVTDVQTVDSTYFTGKYILGGYHEYSEQLSAYFAGKGDERRTNAVFFNKNRKDAEKAYVKLRKKYAKKGVELLALPTGEFVFKAVKQ